MSVYEFNTSTHPEIERYRTKEELMTSTIFSTDKKLDSIIQHISGMPWIIESYFTQLGDVNDVFENASLDVGVHQSYERIMKLKVYLQSAIEQTTPDELNGTFIVNAGFLPKINDPFIAELTGGRLALFQISSVENNTYNNNQCYTCNFKLYTFLEGNNIKYYNNLIKKSVGPGKVYNDDYKFNQNTPLLNTNEYSIREDLIKAKDDLTKYYLNNFINKDTKLLQYPTKKLNYVDTYLLDFIFKIISSTEYPDLNQLGRIDYKDKEINSTVLDMLISRNPQMLYRIDKHLGYKKVIRDKTNLNSRNISLLGIDYIIGKVQDNYNNPKKMEIDKTYKPNLEASVKVHHDETIKKTVENIKKANDDFILMVPKLEFDTKKENIQEKEDEPTIERDDNGRNDIKDDMGREERESIPVEGDDVGHEIETSEEGHNREEETGTEKPMEEMDEKNTEDQNPVISEKIEEEIDNKWESESSELSQQLKPKNVNTSIKATKQYSLFKKK